MNRERNSKFSKLVVVAICGTFLGCGDDDDKAATSDASSGDASEYVSPFELPEGGEFRIFLMEREKGTISAYGQSLWFTDQTPPARAFSGVDIPGVDPAFCADYTSGDHFDDGLTVAGQAIVDTRTAKDVGETVTAKDDMTGDEFTFNKVLNEREPGNGLEHDIMYLADENAPFLNGHWYSLADPELTVDSGTSPLGKMYDGGVPQAYVPHNFTLSQPTEDEFFEGVTFVDGQDYPLSWTANGELDPAASEPIVFAAFYNENGGIDYACGVLYSDGNMVVPQQLIDLLPEKGELQLGPVHHVAWHQIDDDGDTRMDAMGAFCKRVPFEKVVPKK